MGIPLGKEILIKKKEKKKGRRRKKEITMMKRSCLLWEFLFHHLCQNISHCLLCIL